MKIKFTQSINIKRDQSRDFEYTVTSNSRRIFDQITSNYNLGIRSFNIIGTYGSGKSSFLLALEKTLKKEKEYFNNTTGEFSQIVEFLFYPIVGEYDSLIYSIAKEFELESHQINGPSVLSKIEDLQKECKALNKCLVLVVDEFGKFLEFASTHNPDKELYFIQQLAELFNNHEYDSLFISVLHQSFDAYSFGLNRSQRKEWEKVKGRLKDLTFNEPVEQLLYLAAERISKDDTKLDNEIINDLQKIIKQNKLFPTNFEIIPELYQKLYPLDIISAFVITSALQTYGQNERSLFTFLESDEHLGLKNFDLGENAFFDLSLVYDYLAYNYYSFLSTKYNPHYVQWNAIRSAIERTESFFDDNYLSASRIIKTIGLLNIFSSDSAQINFSFLSEYSASILKIDNIENIIDSLVKHKIIRYVKFKDNFVLFEGTDLDIELSIAEAELKINPSIDVVQKIIEYFSFPYMPAKAVHYKYGTPRFFEFRITDAPVKESPKGELDGIVNLIFSSTIRLKDLSEFSKDTNEAILYGLYDKPDEILKILLEIEKINWVITHVADDQIALRELKEILAHQRMQLNNYILGNLASKNSEISWVYNGKEISIENHTQFNNHLSSICEKVYFDIPVFRNELINREKVPGNISSSRKKFFRQLISNWSSENIAFDEKSFPPEKTIYLTLLKNTGIHKKLNGSWTLGGPTDKSFSRLWLASNNFLESSKEGAKNLIEFYNLLLSKPFKLKKGFVDFWIPLFLFIKREDFALFGENGFIPKIGFETIEILNKVPKKFSVKAFDITGVRLDLFKKYQELINIDGTADKVKISSFIQTIKPFLIFYRDLPDYSKSTKRLSKSACKLRDVIANAKDPEKTFFQDFPTALGYSHLDLKENPNFLSDYIFQMQTNIREIRTCFSELINRLESSLLEITGYQGSSFIEYKAKIKSRYKSVKKFLLLPYQKVFYQRLISELDDRDAWIGSIVNAVLNKPFQKLKDEDEEFVYDKFSSIIRELDNLTDIAKVSYDEKKEEILKLEITTLKGGSKSEILRIQKNNTNGVKTIEDHLQSALTSEIILQRS